MTTSLNFAGNSTSNIVVPYSSSLDFGTGDFTIEWYQYETDSNVHPRPFSRGTYPSATTAVSIEGSTFYYWVGGVSHTFAYSKTPNAWRHFAITRSSGITQIFNNGIVDISFVDITNYSSSNNLVIGNESVLSNDAAFGGYMAYFAWNTGYARYTTNFTVSNDYPPIVASTVLLLSAYSSLGTLGSSAVKSNITTVSQVPFIAPYPNPPGTTSRVNTFYNSLLWSLYSDNSRVFYKSNSLSSSIGSTVRNARAVSKRT
jgi:hypothetical protein